MTTNLKRHADDRKRTDTANQTTEKEQTQQISLFSKGHTGMDKLPPCKVCGGRSSGLHYGVMTCESCKMGRVTISDKADRLIEYKDRQEEKIKQTIHETNQIGGNKLLQHGSSEDKLPDETTRDLITMQPKFDNQTHTPHLIFENPETLLTLGDCEAQNMTAIPTQLNGMECGTILQKIKLSVEDNNLVFGAENSAFIDSSLNHSCFQGHEPSLPGERIEEAFKVKQEVFGDLKNLPDTEYYNLYKTTGIDADGRMKQMDDHFRWYEVIVHQYIDFAKRIPGFSSLLTCDQAALLKAKRSECFFFIIHEACDPDTETVMLFSGQTYNIKEIIGWMPEELLKVWTEFCKGIQNLNLTKKEQALILALLITTPSDKYSLKEPEKVEELRNKLELSIEHVVQGTERTSVDLWSQMTRNLISSLQSMKDIEEKEHNSVCQMPSIVNFLLNE
ncbi:NR1D2 [Mytilus edulis]|uniref:NR1D2 n=1 Tax=Mytilus edulis TaxID=6550 RepID=A0A8S3T9T6_MYTED|nr:NR1D2 [Mytilus edulis]